MPPPNGYKRTRAQFADLLYQDLRRVGTQFADTGTIVPAGADRPGRKAGSIYRIAEQGSLIMTDNFLDVAIQGRGLFPGYAARRHHPLIPVTVR
jgi:flagellar basal-body rod protein FlgG